MRLAIFAGLRPFKIRDAGRDVLAGLTLASMDVPQVLGYARIAAMPVVAGLYTALLPLVAFAIFGSSRHLVVAADSATAAIFSSSLSHMAKPESTEYVELVAMLALLTAGLLLLARIFKLGFLANFLSRTVLIGFLAVVGFQVGIAVAGDILGIDVSAHRTIPQLKELYDNFRQFDLTTPQFFLGPEESRVIQRVSTDSGGFDGQAVGVDRGNRGRFQAAATRFSQVAA